MATNICRRASNWQIRQRDLFYKILNEIVSFPIQSKNYLVQRLISLALKLVEVNPQLILLLKVINLILKMKYIVYYQMYKIQKVILIFYFHVHKLGQIYYQNDCQVKQVFLIFLGFIYQVCFQQFIWMKSWFMKQFHLIILIKN